MLLTFSTQRSIFDGSLAHIWVWVCSKQNTWILKRARFSVNICKTICDRRRNKLKVAIEISIRRADKKLHNVNKTASFTALICSSSAIVRYERPNACMCVRDFVRVDEINRRSRSDQRIEFLMSTTSSARQLCIHSAMLQNTLPSVDVITAGVFAVLCEIMMNASASVDLLLGRMSIKRRNMNSLSLFSTYAIYANRYIWFVQFLCLILLDE